MSILSDLEHISNAVHPRAGLTGLAGGPGSPADAPRGEPAHDDAPSAGQPLLWNDLKGSVVHFPHLTLSIQDPTLLSSMDPAQIAAAVQHCPIPLDSALQVLNNGHINQTFYVQPRVWQNLDNYIFNFRCLLGLLSLVMPLSTRYTSFKIDCITLFAFAFAMLAVGEMHIIGTSNIFLTETFFFFWNWSCI